MLLAAAPDVAVTAIAPGCGYFLRSVDAISANNVDFPLPVLPKIPIFSPAPTEKVRSCNTSGSSGYCEKKISGEGRGRKGDAYGVACADVGE